MSDVPLLIARKEWVNISRFPCHDSARKDDLYFLSFGYRVTDFSPK